MKIIVIIIITTELRLLIITTTELVHLYLNIALVLFYIVIIK